MRAYQAVVLCQVMMAFLVGLSAAGMTSQDQNAPDVTFLIEPVEDDALVYLHVAPDSADKKGKSQVSLRLAIANREAKAVHLEKVELTFTGPPNVGKKSISAKMNIGAKKKALWNNASEHNIILPYPPPKMAHVHLHFTGYAAPVTVSKALKAHESPTIPKSYFFPGKVVDLRKGEYWSGSSGHAAGAQGSQLFAYDLAVIAYDAGDKTWTEQLPGTNGTKNEHFRIWGKPVHALAKGSVIQAVDGVPSNPHPLQWKDQAELDAKMAEQRQKYWGNHTNGGAGNHFYIQHGSEVVMYAHMQPGTLNQKLLTKGSLVKAGEFLGLAGNAGNSTAPHLHIHAIKGTMPEVGPLRPLPFHDMHVAVRSVMRPPNPNGPWVKVEGMGLPHAANVIWPGASRPGTYVLKKK